MEIGICDAAINEHLWMGPVDTFFYEYFLVASLYCGVFSCQMNCLFPALPDEEGIGLATLLWWSGELAHHLTVKRSQ